MSTFSEKLRKCLDDRVRQGANGIDLNQGKKGMPPAIIHRNYIMNDIVFDLACKLSEAHEISPHSWVNWMTDAQISKGWDEVKIFHRNKFFCDGARDRFGKLLSDYFKLPVTFIPDRIIESRVA